MAEPPYRPLSAPVQAHLANPSNTGPWPPSLGRLERLSGEAGSRTSGAYVRIHVAVDDGIVRGVRYEVLGGPSLMAAASRLSEILEGRPAVSASVPPGMEIARELELERAEHGMALLAEDAARRALNAAGNGPISDDEA